MPFFRKNRGFQAQVAEANAPLAFPCHRWLWLLMLAFVLSAFAPDKLCGQEATRLSMAGAAAAEAQHQAASTIGYYNLRLGNLALRFTAGAGVQYNDNIHLSNTHREGDEIFTPNLDMAIHLPVTEKNSLDISLGAGYSAYLNNPDMNQFFITPGSGLLYNIYVGDFVINLHERVTVTENGYQNPAVNNGGNNATLQNTVGSSVTWDLNQVVLMAGYDHGNSMSIGASQGIPDSSTENVFINAGFHVRPELTVGLEAGGSSVTYSQPDKKFASTPDTQQWSVGAFGKMQISEYMNAELHAGYSELLPGSTAATFNNTNTPSGTNSVSTGISTGISTGTSGGLYFGLSLTHRVNQWLDYTLSADRSQDLQTSGQPYTTETVRLSPNWKFFEKYSLSTPFWWTQGTQYYYQANTYDQYGGGLNIGRQITEKLSSTLSYQYIQETSAFASLNYTVNIISLNFAYRF